MNKAFIFCDGSDEKEYFQQLKRIFRRNIRISPDAYDKKGKSKTELVEIAKVWKDQERVDLESGDIVCIATDYDYVPTKDTSRDFKKASKLAEENDIEFYFSNDCWELWVLLHFQDLSSAMPRTQIYKILREKWGYDKDDRKSRTRFITSLSIEKIRIALARSSKMYKKNGYKNPSTNIHILIEKILPK